MVYYGKISLGCQRCRQRKVKVYSSQDSNDALRAAIQAVGIAGLFNISPSQGNEVESQKLHCRAISALQKLFNDPVHATSDATLTAVILLALYEIVTFQTQEDYCSESLLLTSMSLTHFEGAIALLESRGQAQFTYERGGHLLGQVCTRMITILKRGEKGFRQNGNT
ncbi:hypothetical protein N7466_003709 [Penicillium verhagenii]|uniref:uncharacterized protein n=1 Tax=Penicillium verhagenii TaxID=1562060 RepID=UPI0025451FDC|nr:uncharacterized protein N7466_003709 [Penicillium verhagenii]KAJ5934162.1 hypothetical protein N7466_003709 [Penicillium verhagenii]